MFIRAKHASVFLVVALFLPVRSLASQEAPKARPAAGAKASSDLVAGQFGLDPKLVGELLAQLRDRGFKEEQVIYYLLIAHERTLRDFQAGKIAKEEYNGAVKERVADYLERYKEDADWRFSLAEGNGFETPHMTRRARAVLNAASPRARAVDRKVSTTTPPYPSHLSEFMVKRLQLPESVLIRGWGELKGVSLKRGLILLILGRERADRLVKTGAVAEGERGNSFVEGVKFFHDQLNRGVGIAELGIQEGKHANELNAESDVILGVGRRAAEARKSEPRKQEN